MGEIRFPWQEPVLAALIELNTENLDAKVGAAQVVERLRLSHSNMADHRLIYPHPAAQLFCYMDAPFVLTTVHLF